MCETPLEVKFMMRETSARSIEFARAFRAKATVVNGAVGEAKTAGANWVASLAWLFGKTEKRAN